MNLWIILQTAPHSPGDVTRCPESSVLFMCHESSVLCMPLTRSCELTVWRLWRMRMPWVGSFDTLAHAHRQEKGRRRQICFEVCSGPHVHTLCTRAVREPNRVKQCSPNHLFEHYELLATTPHYHHHHIITATTAIVTPSSPPSPQPPLQHHHHHRRRSVA